jgi:hypothetical protein
MLLLIEAWNVEVLNWGNISTPDIIKIVLIAYDSSRN